MNVKDAVGWAGGITLVVMAAITGIVAGSALVGEQIPQQYAEGYCTALEGTRLNDETCNVDGKVVPIP